MTGPRAAIRAVVFDFDGVLADSEPLHFRALRELLATLGVALSAADYYEKYVGFDDVGVFEALAAEHGWPLTEARVAALVAEKSRIFDGLMATADVLFPAASRCVERLAAVLPLGIASGALKHEIQGVLRRAGLERHFRFIVAAGDTPVSKPAPDPYLLAAWRHGLPPEACVAIEDTRQGLASARAAGLRTVGISTTYPARQLLGAEAVVTSLDEFTPEFLARL